MGSFPLRASLVALGCLGSSLALGACSGSDGNADFSSAGGSGSASASAGLGNTGNTGNLGNSSGSSGLAGSSSGVAGSSSGVAGTASSGGSIGTAGASTSGGMPGTAGSAAVDACAGITPWTAGTMALDVTHNGHHYTCKVEGWCSSNATAAYEPGVGFGWMDAWTDDGACTAGAGSGGSTSAGGSSGMAGATGTGGQPATGCVLDTLLGESTFESWFPNRVSFYTYANLCKALSKYAAFATTGDVTAQKREVAGFFANVARETGMLEFIDQISKDPATGNYYGRGPLQLTWDYNYRACGTAIGADLIDTPNLVSTDGAITWETGLWFWMTNDGGTGTTPHAGIVAGNFGDTIRAINGGIECSGPNEGANERIEHYQDFCGKLGVDPGSQLTCW